VCSDRAGTKVQGLAHPLSVFQKVVSALHWSASCRTATYTRVHIMTCKNMYGYTLAFIHSFIHSHKHSHSCPYVCTHTRTTHSYTYTCTCVYNMYKQIHHRGVVPGHSYCSRKSTETGTVGSVFLALSRTAVEGVHLCLLALLCRKRERS